MSFRYGPTRDDVKLVGNDDGTVGYFDTLGKYHADPDKVSAARAQLPEPEWTDMQEVVNLEKNGAGPTIWIEQTERDWFN